ncbi:type II toxin-antitoxin system prevent-host-death family antitoxin [Nonomuraea sp. B5E05]|uniref:type II toxin-antitoxin system prevent-host-death family antitoxin n=1 Tax=Nonomuraea sp. B5E05 TaxID=3153569 RepID=UPI003260D059
MIGIREARTRLAELIEAAGGGEPVTLTRRGPGRKQAVLLPVEAAAVWQRHLAEQEAERQRRAQEKELGERLPATKRVPVCPGCKSSYLQVAYTGPVVHALVNTADPDSGIQDVVVDTDVAQLEKVAWVKCASCWEPLADGPRQHGAPAHRAAVEIAENASWAGVPWEATDPWVVKEEEMGRSSRIVLQHDLARGKVQRVSMWEYITGITNAEREQMRAERLARGELHDHDLTDDAEPDLVDAARDRDPDATPHHAGQGAGEAPDADGREVLPATKITASIEKTEPGIDTEHDADRPRLTLVSDRSDPGDAGVPVSPPAATSAVVAGTVHQLKVVLRDVQPLVWRRIQVPSAARLWDLHNVIQIAMGWQNFHLHMFAKDWVEYGDNHNSEYDVTLAGLLPDPGEWLAYRYDFGDCWDHDLVVEKIHRPAPKVPYPRCSTGGRACPPEDSGGPEGFADLLRALRHKKGWKYRQARDVLATSRWDGAAWDRQEVNDQLAELGKQWAWWPPGKGEATP